MADAVGLINGPEWRDLRRSLDRFVNFQEAAKRSGFISQRAQEHIASLSERQLSPKDRDSSEKSHPDQVVINVVQALQPFAFYTSAEIFYGELSSAQRDELWELGKEFVQVAGYIMKEGVNRTRYTRWLYSLTAWRGLWNFQRKWQSFNRTIVQQKQGQAELPIVQLYRDVNDGNIKEQTVGSHILIRSGRVFF